MSLSINDNHASERLSGEAAINGIIYGYPYPARKKRQIRSVHQRRANRRESVAAVDSCDRHAVWQAVLNIGQVFRVDAISKLERPRKCLDLNVSNLFG